MNNVPYCTINNIGMQQKTIPAFSAPSLYTWNAQPSGPSYQVRDKNNQLSCEIYTPMTYVCPTGRDADCNNYTSKPSNFIYVDRRKCPKGRKGDKSKK